MSQIGYRIRKLRLERGLTQEAISSDGVSVPYISRIETGDIAYPSQDALILIGQKLGVSALYLETGDADAHCFYCGRG